MQIVHQAAAFECPLPFAATEQGLTRVKALIRFVSACGAVQQRHTAARFFQMLNRARTANGLPEMTWSLFMATFYFAKTFRVDGPRISWRDLV